MIWLLPAVWFGAAAVAAPLVVHWLARARPSLQPFPSVRFLLDAAPAALRRHHLNDMPLLIVRCAIVLTATAALAGPVLLTSARRADWNLRVVTERIDAPDGVVRPRLLRAVASLSDAPPGRRRIVVRSTFPIGSLTDADIAAIPKYIGVAFERAGVLPPQHDVEASPVLERPAGPSPTAVLRRSRRVVLDGSRTTVSDADTTASSPIDLVAPAAANAAVSAVLTERVLAPQKGRGVRLLVADAPGFAEGLRSARAVTAAWMADAIVRIVRDDDLRSSSRIQAVASTDEAFGREPWHVLALDRDGRPAAAAAADDTGRLLVASAFPVDDLATAVLIRAAANGVAAEARPDDAEVVTISDSQLSGWARAPGPAPTLNPRSIDTDDRRVLWLIALVLIGVESWMRRNDG